MNTETPKNPAAVALGKLGGRPKGSKGQPLDPAKAKAMAQARWAKRQQKTIPQILQTTPKP